MHSLSVIRVRCQPQLVGDQSDSGDRTANDRLSWSPNPPSVGRGWQRIGHPFAACLQIAGSTSFVPVSRGAAFATQGIVSHESIS